MTEKEMLRRAEDKKKIIQLIIFSLDDEIFGVDIDQIREIIQKDIITPIPDSPDFIAGIANVRGEIAVIINLKKRFVLNKTSGETSRHIIIAEQAKTLFGLLVDEVTEVLRISEDTIKPVPKLITKVDKAYINGVLSVKNRLVIILNSQAVLSEEELIQLGEIQAKHRQSAEKNDDTVSKDTIPSRE